MSYSSLILFLCLGLLGITLIDTIGAIASRKMNFKYSYLSILSFSVYTTIGYLTSNQFGLPLALLTNGILGLYDGTLGFWLSISLRANNGLTAKEGYNMLGIKMAFMMIAIALLFAVVGNIFS
ncbi:MAG: hypothetical protein V4685_13360 [Bacteroidota bacterium]